MKIGSLVKVKKIDGNIEQDRGKTAIIISIRLNEHGRVCKLHYFDHDFKYNEYHEGRLEVINEIN